MSKNTYSCTISGRTVAELPWGHDESHPDCVALKLALLDKVAELNAVGVTEFITNCEYGVSLFAAEAVLALRESLGLKLILCMTHENQADRYSREVRERFFDLHSAADEVVILNRQWHENCECEADMYMVEQSDILLTDCEISFIARYAAKQEIQIERLNGNLSMKS
jgi:uncharacterized phage-like protein YoqJ